MSTAPLTADVPSARTGSAYAVLDAVGDGAFVVESTDGVPRVLWAAPRLARLLRRMPEPGAPVDFLRCADTGRDFAGLLAAQPPEFRLRVALGGEELGVQADLGVRPLPSSPGVRVCTLTRVADDWIYAAALDLPLPVIVFDRDMRVRWLNARGLAVVGLPRESLIGRPWRELVPEATAREAIYARAFSGTIPRETRERVPMTFPGQATRYFTVHYRPVHGAGNEVDGLVAIAEETTDQQRAEQALVDSERRLQAITANLLDVVNLVAADGTIRMQCGSTAVSAREHAERVGGSVYDFVHPEDRERYRAWLAEVAASAPGSVFEDLELRVLRGDGSERIANVRAVNHLHVPGVDGILQQVRDDTDARAARRELARAQEALRLAVEAARIGLFEYDFETRRLEGSDEYYLMRRLDPERARARAPDEQWQEIHPDDREALLAELDRVAAHDAPWEIELRLSTGDGDWLWVAQHGRVVERGPDGRARRLTGISVDVDRRKRAERGLAQSEARYRLLVEMTPGFLHESQVDAAGRFRLLWASEGLRRMLGWTVTEFNARGGWDGIIHPADRAKAQAPRADVFGGGAAHCDFRLLAKSGGYVWASSTIQSLTDPETGRAGVTIGTVFDISSLKETEAALRESENRYRLVTELTRGFVYEAAVDPDGRIQVTWASAGAETTFGWRIDELARDRLPLPHFPEDLPLVNARVARLLRGEEAAGESRLYAANGEVRWARFLSRPVKDPQNGRVIAIIGSCEDITDRKRAEEQLRLSELRYRTVTEFVPGFVYESEIRDGEFRTVWASSGIERVYGCDVEGFNRLGWRSFQPYDDPAVQPERMRRLLAGEVVHVERRIRTARGEDRWVRTYARVIEVLDGGVLRMVGVVEDITPAREAAEALRMSEERFRVAASAVQGVIYDLELATGRVTTSRDLNEMLGLPAGTLAPTREAWLARIHPDDRERLSEPMRDLVPGRINEARYRVLHGTGRWIDLWERSTVTADARGAPQRLIGWAVDVSDRLRIERLLADAEALAHVGSWELDVGSGALTWSAETYRIYEVDPRQFEPTLEGTLAFRSPEDRARQRAALEHAIATGEGWDVVAEIVTGAGHRRWVRTLGRADVVEGRTVRVYGVCQDVDALTRAQEALRQQGDWLRMSIEAANMAVWRWYPQTDEAVVEHKGTGMISAESSRPTLAGWLRLVAPEDRQRVRAALEATARDGTPADVEYRLVTPAGDERWFVSRATRSRSGEATVVTGSTQDVTVRRRAQAALEASEATLRSATENAPDFVTIIGTDERIRFANRALRGVPPGELVGRPAREFAVGSYERYQAGFARVLATGEPFQYQSSYLAADGRRRHFEHRLGALKAGDRVDAIIVYSTDTTAQRASSRSLRTQAAVLATMLEGVLVVDGAGRVRLTNPAFDRMFGYGTGALDEVAVATLVAEGTSLPALDGRTAQFVGRRADGATFEAAGVANPLDLDGENYTVYVVQDVTERRALEREVLEISNREQRRIGSDLHDGLGQELTGIALLLSGLASRVKRGRSAAGEEIDELVALVNGAIESARSLARGLSPVELERGGLVYALRALAARAQELYGLEVRFRSRIWPALSLDAAATTHLYRIAQEALTNAARHARASRVQLQLAVRGRSVVLTVTDDGCGMPDVRGTGMGLKIMRYRAGMMGGELVIENAEPSGTRISCRLLQPEPQPGENAA